MKLTEEGVLIPKDDPIYSIITGFLTNTAIGFDPDYLKRQGLNIGKLNIGVASTTGYGGAEHRTILFWDGKNRRYEVEHSVVRNNDAGVTRKDVWLPDPLVKCLIDHHFHRILDERLKDERDNLQ